VAHKLVCTLALAIALPATCGCSSTSKTVAQQQQPSFTDKVTASVKSGTSKMIAAVKPKSSSSKDMPMSPPSGKPGPAVVVAAAQMYESAGNHAEAEANYRKALDLDANDVDALVGYARLEDRQGNFEAAAKFYQRAIKKHPKDASVRNDLGLFYHRRGVLPEATRELKKAVELDPDNKLYRNNLAAAYVEQGKNRDALTHLTVAHGKSVGNYNLAYLLTQKQDNEGALKHFRAAAEADPKLAEAQDWIARLSAPAGTYASHAGGAMSPQGAAQTPANAAYVAQQRGYPSGQAAQYAPPAQAPAMAEGLPHRQTDPLPPMPR
jgi:tetratricopeptide (TPR) repeat protein